MTPSTKRSRRTTPRRFRGIGQRLIGGRLRAMCSVMVAAGAIVQGDSSGRLRAEGLAQARLSSQVRLKPFDAPMLVMLQVGYAINVIDAGCDQGNQPLLVDGVHGVVVGRRHRRRGCQGWLRLAAVVSRLARYADQGDFDGHLPDCRGDGPPAARTGRLPATHRGGLGPGRDCRRNPDLCRPTRSLRQARASHHENTNSLFKPRGRLEQPDTAFSARRGAGNLNSLSPASAQAPVSPTAGPRWSGVRPGGCSIDHHIGDEVVGLGLQPHGWRTGRVGSPRSSRASRGRQSGHPRLPSASASTTALRGSTGRPCRVR